MDKEKVKADLKEFFAGFLTKQGWRESWPINVLFILANVLSGIGGAFGGAAIQYLKDLCK